MYIAKAAHAVRMGYVPVRIYPNSKRPKGDGPDHTEWQNSRPSFKQAEHWRVSDPKSGVGVITGVPGPTGHILIGIDVDSYDSELTQRFSRILESGFGLDVYRVGEAPKRMYVARIATPVRKMTSAPYPMKVAGGIKRSRLEILGEGQQFIIAGTHPDTEKPFTWYRGNIPDIHISELPLLTNEDLAQILDIFETLFDQYYDRDAQGSMSGDAFDPMDPSTFYSPILDLTPDQQWQYLARLPEVYCDEFELWRNVGMALHHQNNGDEEGFQLFDDFSADSPEYRGPEDTRYYWDRFGRNTRVKPISFLFIKKVVLALPDSRPDAPDEVIGEDIVKEATDRYVMLTVGPSVFDRRLPSNQQLKTWPEFEAGMANVTIPVLTTDNKGKPKETMVPLSKLWRTSEDRQTAHGVTYLPGSPPIVNDEHGRMQINQCYIPPHEYTESTDLLGVFFQHMEYLCPNREEMDYLIGWMAWNIQTPHIRCKTTPLHVSIPHRTGRGYLVEALEKLLGYWNIKKALTHQLMRDPGSGGHFQDFLHQSLIVAVEELREPGKAAYSAGDKLRDILTENRLRVNLKHRSDETAFIHCCFFFMTNHPDAIVIPPQDKRIYVIDGPRYRQPKSYYNTLYATLENPAFVAQLYHYLMRYDLTEFPWQNAPMTPAKQRMISSTMSDSELALNGFLDSANGEWAGLTDSQIAHAIDSYAGADPLDGVDENHLKAMLRSRGFTRLRIRFSDNSRPYARQLDLDATTQEVTESVNRYYELNHVI